MPDSNQHSISRELAEEFRDQNHYETDGTHEPTSCPACQLLRDVKRLEEQLEAAHRKIEQLRQYVKDEYREWADEAARNADPDYSPAYQDEYQRLWHEAAAERDKLKEQLETWQRAAGRLAEAAMYVGMWGESYQEQLAERLAQFEKQTGWSLVAPETLKTLQDASTPASTPDESKGGTDA